MIARLSFKCITFNRDATFLAITSTRYHSSINNALNSITTKSVSSREKSIHKFFENRKHLHRGCDSKTNALSARRGCWFSTVNALSNNVQPIRILYASQTGTAKLFAYQLSDQLSEIYQDREISIEGWHETESPDQLLQPGKALHVFLTSVAGVGEPPDNGKAFYDWIMNKDKGVGKSSGNADPNLNGLEYAVFGLGNSAGHAKYFNVIGKSLDARLEELGASRVVEIGLGDDGDCIEDDFDIWMDGFMSKLKDSETVQDLVADGEDVAGAELSSFEHIEEEHELEGAEESTESEVMKGKPRISCPGIAMSGNETRLISEKFPTLKLLPRESDVVRKHLFHLQGTADQFYDEKAGKLDVIGNKLLGIEAGESGIHEMKVVLRDHNHTEQLLEYETGDHLVVYPQNSQCIVDAYCNIVDVDRHAIIASDDLTDSYPFPKGLTVCETLSHCIDLGAPPSPSFTRMILGTKDFDYKKDIAYTKRTVLDLLLQHNRRISLEDLLFQCTPMRPRYYSIASSNIRHPSEIRLVYRKVKYVTSLGVLREGTCTSYLSHKGFVGSGSFAHIPAYVNSNPSFRMPKDNNVPLLFIAGGCGVAPIRALLEERIELAKAGHKLGPGTLFLGFRNKDDEVYRHMIEYGLHLGALSHVDVTYSSGCGDEKNKMVTDVVKDNGDRIWDHFESGGVTYLCGGARSFGAAIESSFFDIIQEHGKMDFEGAERYLRNMVKNGKLMDDLAD
mmetsp:Transcript_22693/g.46671  ORF Transcript_22693/g.46671 Transcript_22693/m.46671 type:complete len:733 (-) Transcript_22693:126-2324(-)